VSAASNRSANPAHDPASAGTIIPTLP